MKKMKFLGIFAVVLSLFQCASVTFEKNPPFKIKGAIYNNYVGGMPGVSGTWVKINYEAKTIVKFDSLFFQGKKTKIELEKTTDKETFVKGHFNTSSVNSKDDLVLHRDGKKEYGNKPPKKKVPFELKENEVVISYIEDGKTKYFKIENLKKGKDVYYPSAKPRDKKINSK